MKKTEKRLIVEERIKKALEYAIQHSGIDKTHHKDWVIGQMVKALTGCPMIIGATEDCHGVMNTVDDRLDAIFDKINYLLCEDLFGLVDDILQYHIVGGSETDILIGYLAITLSDKYKLKNRKSFFNRVRKELLSREDTVERVDNLLKGLE
jgi:hypothetical protein